MNKLSEILANIKGEAITSTEGTTSHTLGNCITSLDQQDFGLFKEAFPKAQWSWSVTINIHRNFSLELTKMDGHTKGAYFVILPEAGYLGEAGTKVWYQSQARRFNTFEDANEAALECGLQEAMVRYQAFYSQIK